MLKVCPECGRLVTVEGPGSTRCPYCGAEVPGEPGYRWSGDRSEVGSPWDDRERLGAFRAYVETWRMVMARPSEFFASMPVSGGLLGPLLYALITGTLGGLASLFWQVVVPGRNPAFEAILASQGLTESQVMSAAVFLAPFAVIVQTFVWAAVLHLMIVLLAGGGRGFEATFRVVSFATTPQLLAVIPVCGGLVASFWSFALVIIGLRESHRISGAVATLAALIPVISMLFLFSLLLYRMIGSLPGV